MAALLTQDPAMGFRSTTPHNHSLNYTSPKLNASTGNVVENTIGTVSAPPLAVASELNVDKLVESITSKIKCEMQVS